MILTMATCASLLWVSMTQAAGTPEQKCKAAKTLNTGKFAACRLKAEGKLETSGDVAAYNNALAKCAGKLTAKYTKVEEGDACVTNGDAPSVIAFVADCSDTVVLSLDAGGSLPECGDAAINTVGEECDGAAFGGRSCASLGFDGGTLSCTAGCYFDTSGCTNATAPCNCGNGTIDAGEDCDLGTLGGATCVSEGFVGGQLGCGSGCVFEASGCSPVRFVDNGNGTVSDYQTGLMWEKKTTAAGGAADYADAHDVDNVYGWSTGGPGQPTGTGFSDFLYRLNGGTSEDAVVTLGCFAFRCDWRLPTIQELRGIILEAYPCVTSPCIDATFGSTQSGYHWSATTRAQSPTFAWSVDFAYGAVVAQFKPNGLYLRAVRSGL